MADFEVYKTYKKLLDECQHCLVAVRLDYIDSAWQCVKRIIAGFGELMEQAGSIYSQDDLLSFVKELTPMLSEMGTAQHGRDQCKVADVVEGQMIPWLSQKLFNLSFADYLDCFEDNISALRAKGQNELADYIASFDKNMQDEHIGCSINAYGSVSFEYKSEEYSANLTGLLHPYLDALFYAYDYRKDEKVSYALAGGCMIYEALAFMAISIATRVFVLEEDKELLFKIFKYIDLKEHIASGRIQFKYKDLLSEVAPFIDEQALLVKSTSLKGILDPLLKKAYATYQMIIVSDREEGYLLFRNFHENKAVEASNIGKIIGDFKGKSIYLIAGGPSLGNSIEVLKARPVDSIIICVGTSAKRLIAENIDPDYVIISDPLPAMERQLNQPFNYNKTSLLFLATTYSEAVKKFFGSRYIVYQNGFQKSEDAAKEEGMPLFQTGGSVTTLALDIALNAEASHIYCMGCDMAYTYNQMHVSGVDDKDGIPKDAENRRVRGVNGDVLETAQNLDSYRRWIEKRLKNFHGTVQITNISDGAYIEGMSNISCEEARKNLI